jgi:hypothetical protein
MKILRYTGLLNGQTRPRQSTHLQRLTKQLQYSAKGRRRALLIGVNYANAPKDWQLKGPSEDVQMFKALLISAFNDATDRLFSGSDVTDLRCVRLLCGQHHCSI